MTRDDIIRMAQEAGAEVFCFDENQPWLFYPDDLERFAALVAEAEREACAKLCDEWNTAMTDKLAAAIRARGTT